MIYLLLLIAVAAAIASQKIFASHRAFQRELDSAPKIIKTHWDKKPSPVSEIFQFILVVISITTICLLLAAAATPGKKSPHISTQYQAPSNF